MCISLKIITFLKNYAYALSFSPLSISQQNKQLMVQNFGIIKKIKINRSRTYRNKCNFGFFGNTNQQQRQQQKYYYSIIAASNDNKNAVRIMALQQRQS